MTEFQLTPEQSEALLEAVNFFELAAQSAVACLLWSEGRDEAIPSRELLDQVICDLAAFLGEYGVRENIDSLGLSAEDVGHNFILSANGHGEGFWSRGWGSRGVDLHLEAKKYEMMTYVSGGTVYP